MTSHCYIIAHALGAWLAKPALSSTLLSAATRNSTISSMAFENEWSLSLKETAKSRYRLKLQLLGISLENYPYISGNVNFQDDMIAWPPVEYGHIFRYFIRRPSVYTQEQLLSWKQLVLTTTLQTGMWGRWWCGTSKTPARARCWKHSSIPAKMLRLVETLCG